jgi:glyoxylase-like metal-dependent hydrolase (beta-lactamase superfamily II)
MRVHHLDFGTFPAPGGPVMVTHGLLLELDDRLALIDSGYGLHFPLPLPSRKQAAHTQVRELGFDPSDVRDIVLTHADMDHAGGVADFPDATVHLTTAEAHAWLKPSGVLGRGRYWASQHKHSPKIVEHDADGEAWRGFAAARPVLDGVVMVSMPGHTLGHAVIAVETGEKTILHAGDAFFDRSTLRGGIPHPARAGMETMVATNHRQVWANHKRLRELNDSGDPSLTIINAHDPVFLREALS